MKKILAILLATIMVLSFVGCGNSTAELEELLVSEKWVCVQDKNISKTFRNNYKGTVEAPGVSGSIDWEIIEEKTVETRFPLMFGGEEISRFVLTSENGIYILSDGEYSFVRESDYETAKAFFGNSYKIPTATIINNIGETEYLTASELIEIQETNEIRFEDMYIGANVTLVAEIREIDEEKIVLGETMMACWTVYNIDRDELVKYSTGDIVVVNGIIGELNFLGEVGLYWDTTIEHYNG